MTSRRLGSWKVQVRVTDRRRANHISSQGEVADSGEKMAEMSTNQPAQDGTGMSVSRNSFNTRETFVSRWTKRRAPVKLTMELLAVVTSLGNTW